jgi:hypothetical protein
VATRLQSRPSVRGAPGSLSVGCVSFLNAKPLIYGLDFDPGVQLGLDVPSRLLDGLREGRYDVALLPVIDYQRMERIGKLIYGLADRIGNLDHRVVVDKPKPNPRGSCQQ